MPRTERKRRGGGLEVEKLEGKTKSDGITRTGRAI
jgi:hypothetical protein